MPRLRKSAHTFGTVTAFVFMFGAMGFGLFFFSGLTGCLTETVTLT